ncbi:pyridoxal phosphate-dependent decarboxylase family protein [Dokdonia ponticola]|uniref:Pyridoxal phosphate-dependent decarboxylase family protein n=1 Tax=Dokdonia ponticola TaxID=2041041 RepID=A0ABV9I0T0_9FLAO
MSTSLLHKAYDSRLFNEQGNDLVQQISHYLAQNISGEAPTMNAWVDPQEEYAFWKAYTNENHPTPSFFETVLKRSIHIHHPHCIGHQVAPTVPVSALATLLSAQLNNGMAVYEMGQASSAIERVVIEFFAETIGWANGDGFLTSGGTLANLTALLAARKAKASSDVWNEGHGRKLAIMVSEEAHYCVDRSARIMGLGEAGIIKVPVGDDYKIRVDLLQQYYNKATQDGFEVISVIGSAPSTSTGIYDDLEGVSAFAKANNLWFHVDGAHGGAAIFSKKYKHLVNGIAEADSVIIDGHKMMGTSSITTAVLFKNTADSYATFSQKAQYLWEQNDDPDWYNYAKRTFECTKSMMSLRFYAILNAYGVAFFDDFVTTLYDSGRTFSEVLKQHPDFEIALEAQSNIVCFRYTAGISKAKIQEVNKTIRKQLLEEGEFYIVSTVLKGEMWLRTTFMNPFTTEAHTQKLIEKIRTIAKKL